MGPRPIVLIGENDIGAYSNLTVRSKAGVRIRGEYSFLNLSGARISAGPLIAEYGSRADNVLLSGAYIPEEVDLSGLEAQGFYAQGMEAGRLVVCGFWKEVDLSWSKIGELNVQGIPAIRLNLRDGTFNSLILGSHTKLRGMDLRGTVARRVYNQPADIDELLFDEETRVPQDLAKYLIMHQRFLEKGSPFTSEEIEELQRLWESGEHYLLKNSFKPE